MTKKPVISLFIPCLVDQVYPEIGIDMAKILTYLGYQIEYNNQQTCCGQPAFNAGHWDEARKVAEKFIADFTPAEMIVSPSGSCTAMVKKYYATLFTKKSLQDKVSNLANKIFEFSEFLALKEHIKNLSGEYHGKVGFHNSCHSLRELHINQIPFDILKKIKGIEIVIPHGESVCCGFGGLFSFKYDEIAATMAKTRIEMFTSLNADTIVTNDPGCLMHMRQEAVDRKIDIKLLHLTEFLVQAIKL